MDYILGILILIITSIFSVSAFILAQYKDEIYKKIERSDTE